jgi:8-oxo-dGTP diphosphatase
MRYNYSMENYPKIGTGVMIWKDGKVLLGKRKGSHGAGTYSFPGGALDYGETLEACLRREVKEECGLEIENLKFVCISDELDHMPKHFINIVFRADWKSGEPTIMEPDKSENWDWYPFEHLPEPLFVKTREAIEAYQKGINYFSEEKNA